MTALIKGRREQGREKSKHAVDRMTPCKPSAPQAIILSPNPPFSFRFFFLLAYTKNKLLYFVLGEESVACRSEDSQSHGNKKKIKTR